MRRIGGLDTSLTSTGIAIITRRTNGTCLANVTTVRSTGHRGATYLTRGQRLSTLRNDIIDLICICYMVVIERPLIVTKSADLMDRIGLFWTTVGRLQDLGVLVAVAPPTTHKKAITGHGDSGKGAVVDAIKGLWPDVTLNPKGNNAEDEADALSLAHIGAVKAGWEVPTLQRHRDALPAVAWPDQPVAELEETA
jgi:Holliday junction resolvasome RuvABC endonuclease subunit